MTMDFFEKVINGSAFGSEFFKALDEATTIDPRIEGVQSTKGML